MNKVAIVARQTFKKRVTSKSFIIIMLLPFILLSFVSMYLLVLKGELTIDFSSVTNGIIEDESIKQKLLAMITMIIIFLFIGTCSNMIAQEIGSDKGTKLMEVILTSMRSKNYFIGKLTGIFLVSLVQLAGYGVATLAGIGIYSYFTTTSNSGEVILNLMSSISLWNVVFLIFGIISYTLIAAMLGSLVTKKEDISNSANPILALALVGIYIGLWMASSAPNSLTVKISSYLPFFSPFVMPIRMASIELNLVSIIISSLILIFYSIFLFLISMRIYNKNALNYTEKSLFQIIKGT